MKKLTFLLCILGFLVACNSNNNKDQDIGPITMEMKIDGMSCNGCVATVEASVKQMGEGITSVVVNLDSANAVIEYDPAMLKEKKIKEAIELNGYKVTEVIEK